MGKVKITSAECPSTEMDISLAHQHRLKKGMEGEGIYTDQCVKFCTKCRACYEIVMNRSRRNNKNIHIYTVEWFKDFPSYGKEKKTCPRCLGQEVIKIVEE